MFVGNYKEGEKMFFVNTNDQNIPPKLDRCTLLKDIDYEKELNFEEIMEITNSSYSDNNWSRLAHFMGKKSYRSYQDNQMNKIIKTMFSNSDILANQAHVNCLFYNTYLRIPSVCDWTRHFSFFISDYFIGSLDIYAMQLSMDASDYFAVRQIANIAQNQINTNRPFLRFMVAIVKEDKWELAFCFIEKEKNLPKHFIKARKIKIQWFKKPAKFFDEILRGGNVFNIPNEEFIVKVRV